MMGVQGRPTTRRIMKLEKPRPLKISSIGGDQSIETVLSEMDLVSQKLSSAIYDHSLFAQITSLCENLKIFGSQIESVYKDQLDRCYVALRNGCRDDCLPLLTRYRMLEVIELRAMNWQPNENLISYYQQKLGQMETEELSFEDANENELNCINPIGIMSPTTPNSGQIFQGPFSSLSIPQVTHRITNPQPQPPAPHVVPGAQPLLNPGELLKSSGKFATPIRVPGKNHFKDEIVIRNADSGKVMGLKGRRVHMIEELSETVISLQRVAPGARERLVQITGGGEENISQAKHLIEETIRRNASPIRSEDSNRPYIGSSSSPVSSRASDEMLQDMSLEDNLVEYRYTVTHDNDIIRITGNNLDFVKTAKLILDEYFNEDKVSVKPSTSTPVSVNSKNNQSSNTVKSKSPPIDSKTEPVNQTEKTIEEEDVFEVSKSSVVTVLRQPLIPSSSKDIVEFVESNSSQDSNNSIKNRRMLFAKTNESKSSVHATEELNVSTPTSISSSPSTNVQNRISYSREILLGCAASPACRAAPDNWAKLPSLLAPIIRKEITYFDPSKYLSAELLWSGVRALSAADEEESTNTNEN